MLLLYEASLSKSTVFFWLKSFWNSKITNLKKKHHNIFYVCLFVFLFGCFSYNKKAKSNGVNAWLVDEDDDGTKDDPKEIVGKAEDEDDRHEIPDCTKENIVEDEKNSKEEGEPNQ